MEYRLFSPRGRRIIGTNEIVPAVSFLTVFKTNEKGDLVPEHTGDTDLDWNNGYTVRDEAGKMELVDLDHNFWPENKCTREPITCAECGSSDLKSDGSYGHQCSGCQRELCLNCRHGLHEAQCVLKKKVEKKP